MISVQNLTRRYQDLVAVDNVSFKIAPNEIVGLLGHNGAGKTTVMKMLTGYLSPSSGHIIIGDYHLPEHASFIHQELGYLPEALPVYPEMTVVDYLEYIAHMRNILPNKRFKCVKQVIEDTDLGSKALQPIQYLSRGYKQRVGVASAILHKPKVLILDEPTNGLDPEQTQHMRELIRNLARNATVILSTHIMQEVESTCSRVLILQNGKLMINKSLAQLRQSSRIELCTDLTHQSLKPMLHNIPEITECELVKSEVGKFEYFLQTEGQTSLDNLISQVVSLLVGQGGHIFRIQPEHRGLESVIQNLKPTEVMYAN